MLPGLDAYYIPDQGAYDWLLLACEFEVSCYNLSFPIQYFKQLN
jgi:hypothetical protein